MTEEREVIYPWHPWSGRTVHVHEVVGRGDGTAFPCGLTGVRAERCLEVPAWMFDRVACLHIRVAASPQVDWAALMRLKTLLAASDRAAAALRADRERVRQRDDVRAALGRDLEAARYAADRAFRQYKGRPRPISA